MATKRYGQWIIVKSLPEGGQAHTFLVRREGDPSNKQFVLKRLKNPQRIQRFRHELEAVKRLSHTNVLKWIDHDLEHVSPYIVTEYCPGGTLSTLNVTRSAVLDRLRMFAAICDGVAHAHEHDVIHRDLKPGNIFLRSDLSPVGGDFGLCLLSDEEERLTRSDEVVGARWYSAPELEDGRAETITCRADVYALGKILYWMLAGRIFAREKHRDPEFDLTKRYPEPSFFLINELLDSLIAANLSRRYEFAQEVAHAVRQLIKRIEARGHAMIQARLNLAYIVLRGSISRSLIASIEIHVGNTTRSARLCKPLAS